MAFHWQSNVNVQHVGVEDMVLLSKLTEQAIADNLKKRLHGNSIFWGSSCDFLNKISNLQTYIGPVLISVNPFKQMPYFTEKDMDQYQGAAQYENPPHIYALADNMYRYSVSTASARYFQPDDSGARCGSRRAHLHVKDVILQSNPLLEAFGNSATVRNWNSSRFGKYVQISFGRGGEPIGGKVTNFLLEKSRVVQQNRGDRNFHIFYQLCAGAGKNIRLLQFPAFLLGLPPEAIQQKLTARKMESRWGNKTETIDVTLNVEQANYTRDAWTKAIHARVFDYLVDSVNRAIQVADGVDTGLSIGILDIYGFEIFDHNGFEQFCINFVNEKLQQIFIELTLKAEQEEYVREQIRWQEIDYFNNKVVCDLIEAKRPPGIMCILDDVCAQNHGQSEGVDAQLLSHLNKTFSQHPHYQPGAQCFLVKHYAGDVVYDVDGFCDRNRDVLYPDLILLMQQSSNAFLRSLFPENANATTGKRPTTASTKIRNQANALVESLMKCTPHYVRCIKPNETKKPGDWDDQRVRHQVEYLGLRENIRVRRAGFAYRRSFEKFLWRYAILTQETWPSYRGDPRQGCQIICRSVNMDPDQFQMGTSKIFIKNPESLFLLEEVREKKYDGFARKIQKAWRQFNARKHHTKQKEQASDLFFGKKERRRYSLNRNFVGDYIGLEYHPVLQSLVGKRERVDFAHTVTKYDRRFKPSKLDLLLTAKHLTLIGREKSKEKVNKGQLVEVVKRQIDIAHILSVGLSPYQDDFLVINVRENYSSLLETPFKTELITALSKHFKERTRGGILQLEFLQTHTITLKKTRFGGGTRQITFHLAGVGQRAELKPNGKVLHVTIGQGLPNTTRETSNGPPYNGLSAKSGQTEDFNAENASSTCPSSAWWTGVEQQPRNDKRGEPKLSFPHRSWIDDLQVKAVSVRSQPVRNRRRIRPGISPRQQASVQQVRMVKPILHKLVSLGIFLDNPTRYGGVPTALVQGRAEPRAADVRPAPRPNKPKPPAKPRLYPIVKALYDYDAQDTDELSFSAGDEIELMQKHDSGWWQGKLGDKIALFPANYVQE
ncbi:myosin head [Necator americanus]|uniref:Myosin head n=1 Tax=Necator americanus TaxID=51031 RepID=W2TLN0_NECAM|nr:myosin head [Necator americanus]ETN81932.1 myosin head [Necator americanus]